jgi:hypothetical protein
MGERYGERRTRKQKTENDRKEKINEESSLVYRTVGKNEVE